MQNWIVRIHLSSTNESTWASSTGRTTRSRSGRTNERVPRGCSTSRMQDGIVSIRMRSRDKSTGFGSTGAGTRSRGSRTPTGVPHGRRTINRVVHMDWPRFGPEFRPKCLHGPVQTFRSKKGALWAPFGHHFGSFWHILSRITSNFGTNVSVSLSSWREDSR